MTLGGSLPEAEDPSLDASALYDLRPDEFTKARNDLVKRLRAAGRREDASGVARMRKPPATAWALNQVARQRPDLVASVFDAGDRLRVAMDVALAGDPSGVRPARVTEREAVAGALKAATGLLDEAGHSATDAVRRRIEATLRAAMVDDSVAERLSQGKLDSDHDASGFAFAGSGSAPSGSAPSVKEPGREVDGQEADGQDGQEAEQEEAARQEAEREEAARQEAARQEAARQEAAAERAGLIDQAERLARRAEELEATAQDAEAVARGARDAADHASLAAAEARLAVDRSDPAGEGL